MKYSITYTQKAIDDLKNISDYIIYMSGSKEVAVNFINEMDNTIKILEDFPLSGFYPNNRSLKRIGYRYLVFKEYLVFYIVKKDKVFIMTILNSKQDYFRFDQF